MHDGLAAMVRSLRARREVLAVDLLQVGGRIIAAEAGDPLEALGRIAPLVRSTYFRTIPRQAEALVLQAEGVLARSFYQADKAVKNSEWAVRDGGVLVLVADCPDGIGQDHFMSLLAECDDHASLVAAVQRRGYRLGDHKAVKLRYLTDVRGVRVFVVSDGLSEADAAVLGFAKADSPESALAAAGVAVGSAEAYCVPDACNTCVVVDAASPDDTPQTL